MRLIDADVLKEKAKWYNIYSDKPPHSIHAVTTQEIDWMPTVFSEPKIIRCKDCENSYLYKDEVYSGETYRYCNYLRHRYNLDFDRIVDDEDFCTWVAPKKEGAEEE